MTHESKKILTELNQLRHKVAALTPLLDATETFINKSDNDIPPDSEAHAQLCVLRQKYQQVRIQMEATL